ncbi:MAG TPA: 3-deoxy-manno-octulosonate cytidylyltransferase [Pirellulales bacterium]|jgi:3-deoxy-manno-octulosonate cytidylyltransferase (CMP-KDO synthetase)
MSQAQFVPRIHSTSLIVIPARLASSRLPRKMLLCETGKSLIQHTFEAASRASRPIGVCVATDHAEILDEVTRFGGQVEMTSESCASGTDRVAEIARRRPDIDIFVNVQGDEPELAGHSVDLVVELLERDPRLQMSTLATPIRRREQLLDPACVKVVFDSHGRALYFSRYPIPFVREWRDELLNENPPNFFQHVGLYAYRRDFLLQIAQMPPARIEQLEKLEQLRVLDAGHSIAVGVVDEPTVGIDTPEDYAAFVRRANTR